MIDETKHKSLERYIRQKFYWDQRLAKIIRFYKTLSRDKVKELLESSIFAVIDLG